LCKYGDEVELSALADEYVDEQFFNIIARWPKTTWLANRRRYDQIYSAFCLKHKLPLADVDWGLPIPNLPAAYQSLAKYGKGQPVVDDEIAMLAKEFMYREFFPYMQNSQVFSTDESILELDLSTSPGFPWNLLFKTKRDFFNWEGSKGICEDAFKKLGLPSGWWWIWTNALKEEIRPMAKILENKIRTFTASPVDLTVAGNQLCLDMNQKFYESHLKTASTVGLDPFHGGWDLAYRKVKKHPNGYELDENAYDSSLFIMLFQMIFCFRVDCLADRGFKQHMHTLYQNIVWSIVVTADGLILQKKTGNPSGSINTIVDNTLILYWLLAYAWIKLAPVAFRTYESFNEHVSLLLTGDDNTWTVSDEANVWFNGRSVSQVLSSLGITTTSPCYDARPVEELTYLSRSFNTFIEAYGEKKCVPVLDKSKFVASLRFSEKPVDPVYALVRACGFYQVSWADAEMRKHMVDYIDWLIKEYDDVLYENADWRAAKAGYHPYSTMLSLYTQPGKSIVHKAQEKTSIHA